MSRLESYDKIIWRFNGTLILVACIGVILAGLIMGYKFMNEVFLNREVHDLVNVDHNTKKEEYLNLGFLEPLAGTDLALISLNSEQNYNVSYYSKTSSSNTRNYLLFNLKTKTKTWLWNDNKSLVFQVKKIVENAHEESTSRIVGLVFEFVKKDSNADKLLSSDDQKSIYYFHLATNKFLPVVEQVDRSISIEQHENGQVLFFYSRGGESFFRSLALASMVLSAETKIVPPV